MTTQTQTKPPASESKYKLTHGLDQDPLDDDDAPDFETPPISTDEDDKE